LPISCRPFLCHPCPCFWRRFHIIISRLIANYWSYIIQTRYNNTTCHF
jgi:hypothetical protein